MPTSKKDKSRKDKLTNFKKNQKKQVMSNAPDMKPFRQVPNWQSTETFEIQGSELEALYNYFNIVAPAFTAIQQVFARGIQGGKIKVGYEYEDGTPVSDAEVKAYTEKLGAYFKNKLKAEGLDADNVETEVVETTGRILTADGVPATTQG
jgi:hypothetical protein